MLRVDFVLDMLLLIFILRSGLGWPVVLLWNIKRKEARQELI